MITITINWLNKCRCGNKSHTVKTARGNETALWDDDTVKCNSCGRGGVIQVCEGQARVLWETDEEMAEGKPMSTITKERAQEIFLGNGPEPTASEERELARIALASLEAEAVCVIDQSNLDYLKSGSDADVWPASRTEMGDVLLYRSAPPAPASVPDGEWGIDHSAGRPILVYKGCSVIEDEDAEYVLRLIAKDGARAAMLQGAEPVTTAYKLRDAVEIIRNSGIAIDAEKILAERDALNAQDCWCRTCRPITLTDMRFVVCPACGNKRCPHANDHRNACTGSNEPGQEGSAYPAAPQQEVK